MTSSAVLHGPWFEERKAAMTDLDKTLSLLEPKHKTALIWFHERVDEVVFWPEPLPDGTLLASKPKGIYKPAWTKYALSVRKNLDSPYLGKERVTRPDGSWSFAYYQENLDPTKRDSEYTNRGLMQCLNDKVPVGVMVQVAPKPESRYRVLGVAMVTGWEGGYFFFEGFSTAGNSRGTAIVGRINILIHDAEEADTAGEEFDPSDLMDGRERAIASMVRRRGQPAFRKALIDAYGGKCAITGCDVEEALEAAHIVPYQGNETNHVTNGLLLRADLHNVFDLGLVAIDSESMTVLVGPELVESTYKELTKVPIRLPQNPLARPSKAALDNHRLWCGL
jgi:hypothetical protein|tara:strand:- start:2118 stop:3125 length:1008 start_codon:yes stop_codon:yes gene_type:complete